MARWMVTVGRRGCYTRALEHSETYQWSFCVFQRRIKKFWLSKAAVKRKRKQREEKMDEKEEGNWRSCSYAFFFYPMAPHICACFTLIAVSSSKHLPKFSLLSIPSKVCDPLLSFSSLPSRFSSVSVCMQLLLRPPPFLRHHSFGQLHPHRFQPLFLLLLLYMGNTRKPEKVEYFHPPMRFPLSSLRYARSPFSIWIRTPLLAASRVTSWSPAKAEITGQPLCIRLTWSRQKRVVNAMERDSMDSIRLQTTPFCLFVFLTPLLTWKIRTLTKYQETHGSAKKRNFYRQLHAQGMWYMLIYTKTNLPFICISVRNIFSKKRKRKKTIQSSSALNSPLPHFHLYFLEKLQKYNNCLVWFTKTALTLHSLAVNIII